jgi:hypothetical protein
MTQSFRHVPPPNQFRIEQEFYAFIQRPELRGFNARLAEELGHESDSHVSRMHSPHVPETPSWLYKSAVSLDKACRADVRAAQKALDILRRTVAAHTHSDSYVRPDDAAMHSLCSDMQQVLLMRSKGAADDEDVRSSALKLRTVLDELLRVSPVEAAREAQFGG